MRPTLAIVASLVFLAGCNTTGELAQPSNDKNRLAQHAFLIEAINEVCLDNIGNAEAIDEAARELIIEEPQNEQSQIGFREVTATIYPIGDQGSIVGVIEQKEGESCALITEQSMEFSKTVRDTLQLKMEDMGEAFDFDAVQDLRYGFIESHNLPLKQYKQFTKRGRQLDVIAFMTPQAFRDDSQVFGMVAGALARREANPGETASDIFTKVIDGVCVPNIGNSYALEQQAQAISGSSGVQLDRPEIKLFVEELQIHLLSVSPDEAFTFVGVSSDGGLCGYWAVGAGQETFDVFETHDLMQVGGELVDDGLVELGFSPDENLAFFQSAVQRDGRQIYFVMVIGREAYSQLDFHDLPALPWGL